MTIYVFLISLFVGTSIVEVGRVEAPTLSECKAQMEAFMESVDGPWRTGLPGTKVARIGPRAELIVAGCYEVEPRHDALNEEDFEEP